MVTQRNSSFVGAAPAQGTAGEMFINAVFWGEIQGSATRVLWAAHALNLDNYSGALLLNQYVPSESQTFLWCYGFCWMSGSSVEATGSALAGLSGWKSGTNALHWWLITAGRGNEDVPKQTCSVVHQHLTPKSPTFTSKIWRAASLFSFSCTNLVSSPPHQQCQNLWKRRSLLRCLYIHFYIHV